MIIYYKNYTRFIVAGHLLKLNALCISLENVKKILYSYLCNVIPIQCK